MNPQDLLTCPKPETWSELNKVVDSLDTTSLPAWYDVISGLNDGQVWMLAMALNRQERRLNPEFSIRLLDRLPEDGAAIDVIEWVVNLTHPYSEEFVKRLWSLALDCVEAPERRVIAATLVGKLAARIMRNETGPRLNAECPKPTPS